MAHKDRGGKGGHRQAAHHRRQETYHSYYSTAKPFVHPRDRMTEAEKLAKVKK